ncbi:MAG: hypothetical protein ACE5HI_16235 [bacterium]
MKITNIALSCLSLLVVFSISCSNKPSENLIKTAITRSLEERVPVSWAGSLLGGNNAKIESIDILQIGKYSEQRKYWPIKARVKGFCDANLLVRTERKEFDRTGDFKLYQDDYGNWKAVLFEL